MWKSEFQSSILKNLIIFQVKAGKEIMFDRTVIGSLIVHEGFCAIWKPFWIDQVPNNSSTFVSGILNCLLNIGIYCATIFSRLVWEKDQILCHDRNGSSL